MYISDSLKYRLLLLLYYLVQKSEYRLQFLNIGAEMIVLPGPMAFISPFFVLVLTLSMFFGIHAALGMLNRKEAKSGNYGTK